MAARGALIKSRAAKLAPWGPLGLALVLLAAFLASWPRPAAAIVYDSIKDILNLDTSINFSRNDDIERGKSGMIDLQRILHYNTQGQACTAMVYKTYKHMHDEYYGLARVLPMLNYGKTFAAAYAYQLVGHCKLDAASQVKKIDQIAGEKAMAPMRQLEASGAWLLDETVLPGAAFKKTDLLRVGLELAAFIRDTTGRHPELAAQMSPLALERLKELRVACLDVYMPVWLELTYTIANMADMGYDVSLNDRLNRLHRARFNADKDIRRWINTILACEAVHRQPMFGNYKYQGSSVQVEMRKSWSEAMPDKLVVNQDTDLDELKSTAKEVSKETEELKRAVYKHVLGSNWSVSDRLAMSGSKFWTNYVAFLNQKLST